MRSVPKEVYALYDKLFRLREEVMTDGERLFAEWLPHIERRPFRFSALNLAYYLSVRCHDLRPLQEELVPLGLSSLGRSEARTMANLDAVMATLGRLCGKEDNLIDYPSSSGFFTVTDFWRIIRALFSAAMPNITRTSW